MVKAPTVSHKERMAADTAALLTDAIDAGGMVSIKFTAAAGLRVRINLDRVANAKATALYLRYRNADTDNLVKAAGALLSEKITDTIA